MILDGLWDPYNDVHMGTCADRCAKEHCISRTEQDAHAVESHKRAQRAHEAGFSGRVRSACPLLSHIGMPGQYTWRTQQMTAASCFLAVVTDFASSKAPSARLPVLGHSTMNAGCI